MRCFLPIVIAALLCFSNMAYAITDSIPESTKDSVAVKMLDEMVVTGKKKYVRNEGPRTYISISGSPYSGFHNLTSMLENLPGMSPSANGPVVTGIGVPKYYVDGREIKDISELRAIEPSNIESIEINKLPGFEYGVETPAVVLIKLKKSMNDYFYMNVGTYLQQKRNFDCGLNMNLRYKNKKFSTSLFVADGSSTNELRESYTRRIIRPDYTTTNIQARTLFHKSYGPVVRYIAEYNFNDKSFIGFYYNYTNDRRKNTPWGTNSIDTKDINDKWDYREDGKKITNTHNFTLQWDWKNKNVYLRLSQDVYLSYSPGHSTSWENKLSGDLIAETRSGSDADYQAYTTNAKMWLSNLPWGLSGSAGVRYDHVDSKTNSIISGNVMDYYSDMNVDEDNVNAYLVLTKKFGNVTIKPQLSYTYTNRHVGSRINQDPSTMVKQRYSSFYPQLYIEWKASEDITVYGNYRRYISQPGFRALNSGLVYKNQWEWEDSNPDLRASVDNSGVIGMTWKSLSMRVSYSQTRDVIVSWESLMSPESDAVAEYNVNMPRISYWSANVSYSGSIGKVNYYASLSCVIPRYRMLVNNVEELRNKPAFYPNLNLNYQLNKHFTFTTTYTYSGKSWTVPLVYQRGWQRWDIGIQSNFLDNRLSVSLELKDILKTANYSNHIDYYNTISQEVSGRSDFRGVELTISYTIFNKRVNNRTENGNDDVKYRIMY